MTDQMVHLTIDGLEIVCPGGCTVYEAATGAGIHIPTFCHHEKLVPVGACRMCLVEIEGARGLQTSCTAPVREGMVVKVHTSPGAIKARKANIEFLLTNHPLDCPVCDKGGECPLQDQTLLDGPGQSRYVEEKRHKQKRHPLGDLIVLDQERCVLCWRCIRFLDEWAGDHELDVFGRGAGTRIDTFPGRPLTSKWQGNMIDICPVGALTSRIFRFEARVWELVDTPSICPMCSVGCNILLGVKNNELRRIVPRENKEVNDVWICDRGRFTHGFVDHRQRLTTPLVRRGGELEPATWDEALDLVAQRFTQAVQEHGPQAIAGLGSTRVTNEALYLFQRFMRSVVGSNSVDHLGRMPDGAMPLTSLPELEHKDAILLLGVDPSTEAPLVELWIKKAVLRHGAQVLVANPQKTELGGYSGLWLGHRPGAEIALLNGLASAILDAGLENTTTRVTNLDEFRTWLQDYDLGRAEQETGVPAGTLRQAAQILGQARNPAVLYGTSWLLGLRREPHSSHTAISSGSLHRHELPGVGVPKPSSGGSLAALTNLGLLLGGVEVGFVAEDNNTLGALEMGVVPDLYPGRRPVKGAQTRARSRLAGMWGGRLSPVEGLGFDGMMAAALEGDLQAMWIMGVDPANDCRIAGDALGRIPFLVVQDLFLTETSALAEVVLPAASFAEVDGTFINLTGRLQMIRAAKRSPGQARPDWWIITELARRMVDGKRQKAWDFGEPGAILNEISKVLPGCRGVDFDTVGDDGWQPPESQAATRRVYERVAQDPPAQDSEYPLTLITGRLLYDRGTLLSHSEGVQNLVPAAYATIHPTDAARMGLADGDNVSVVSAQGRLGFTLKVSDEIVPGVVFAPLNLSDAPLSVLFSDRWSLPRVRIVK
jgi:NADH-quinone oxidoreductase chain G